MTSFCFPATIPVPNRWLVLIALKSLKKTMMRRLKFSRMACSANIDVYSDTNLHSFLFAFLIQRWAGNCIRFEKWRYIAFETSFIFPAQWGLWSAGSRCFKRVLSKKLSLWSATRESLYSARNAVRLWCDADGRRISIRFSIYWQI